MVNDRTIDAHAVADAYELFILPALTGKESMPQVGHRCHMRELLVRTVSGSCVSQ